MNEAQSLHVEEKECITLSPESERFRGAYQQVQPRSAAEVREILGVSAEGIKAIRESGVCCAGPKPPVVSVDPADLESEDPEIRAVARQATYAAFNAYVHGNAPASLEYLAPAFDRYLHLNKAIINLITLRDIEVDDGATLTISASTHVVAANKVIIHATGRIVCRGSTTFRIASLEGIRFRPSLGSVAKPSSVMQSRRKQ